MRLENVAKGIVRQAGPLIRDWLSCRPSQFEIQNLQALFNLDNGTCSHSDIVDWCTYSGCYCGPETSWSGLERRMLGPGHSRVRVLFMKKIPKTKIAVEPQDPSRSDCMPSGHSLILQQRAASLKISLSDKFSKGPYFHFARNRFISTRCTSRQSLIIAHFKWF